MLFLLIVFMFTNASCLANANVGSVLFYKRNSEGCWNQDDMARLRARKIFEKLALPLPELPPDKINAKYNKDLLKYLRKAIRIVGKNDDSHNAQILRDALADTIGGHLRHKLLPNSRFAYYAGYVPYKSVRQLHDFYDDIKIQLNTQGVGWMPPEKTPLQSNLTVGKILIGEGKPYDPCSCLVIKRDSNNCIHIPPPKVDDEEEPAALALPFKAGSFISLTSPNYESVLLKYYTTAARCILHSSPNECRHADFVNFNNELWHWMKRYVAPHLLDEKLYSAYGGILRIAAAVQNYGKGLSRRNLYENDYMGDKKWQPLRKLTQKQYYIDADWTPQLYISIVMGAALAICFLHICYNIVCGRANACHCPGQEKLVCPQREVAYAHVDSNFPAMLPSHHSGAAVEQKRSSLSRSKSASAGTVKTQRVYDFNDNAEKLMSVIMSDNEITELESSTSRESEIETMNKTVASVQAQTKPTSPPKIEAPMAQLKIDKTPTDRSRQMYSTSTVTQSEVTYCGQVTDTAWSGSYSTEHSASTVSTKSRTQRSRRSRDLAWARRVISKQTIHGATTKSTTGTDMNSYTTPPSRR